MTHKTQCVYKLLSDRPKLPRSIKDMEMASVTAIKKDKIEC